MPDYLSPNRTYGGGMEHELDAPTLAHEEGSPARVKTNGDMMRTLVGAPQATNEEIFQWAYMNRIWLIELPDEPEFTGMQASVDDYFKKHPGIGDEDEYWRGFLKAEYVPGDKTEEVT